MRWQQKRSCHPPWDPPHLKWKPHPPQPGRENPAYGGKVNRRTPSTHETTTEAAMGGLEAEHPPSIPENGCPRAERPRLAAAAPPLSPDHHRRRRRGRG